MALSDGSKGESCEFMFRANSFDSKEDLLYFPLPERFAAPGSTFKDSIMSPIRPTFGPRGGVSRKNLSKTRVRNHEILDPSTFCLLSHSSIHLFAPSYLSGVYRLQCSKNSNPKSLLRL